MNGKKQFFGCATIVWLVIALCGQTDAQSTLAEAEKPDSQAGDKPIDKSILVKSDQDRQPAPDFCQCVGDSETVSVERIERALRAPLHSSGLDFVEQPLSDVISALQDDYGIPIQLDTPALEEIGIAADEQVNTSLHNISLRSALRLMLKRLQLTYVIQDEVLIITTPQEAESQLKTCVYDVAGTGERDVQMDAIIDTVLSCVATDTWAKNGGGQAEIRAIKPGLLVVSQTQPVHDEIRNLLSTIKKMREARSSKGSTAAIEPHSVDEVVTRSYLLQFNPTNDNDTMRSQVRELIVSSLPEESWTGRLVDGQAVTLTVFHDRIVVRQTPAVQAKVQKILADSGVAMPAQAIAENPSGGGGMGGGGGGRGFFRPEMGGRYGMGVGPGAAEPTWSENAGPASAGPGAIAPIVGDAGISPEPAKSE